MKVGELGRGKVRFVIYSNDHAPAHVHAQSPDASARIAIGTAKTIDSRGFSFADLKALELWVFENQIMLLEVWNEIQET